MFEGLKKKFSNFIKSVSKKEEEEIKEEVLTEIPKPEPAVPAPQKKEATRHAGKDELRAAGEIPKEKDHEDRAGIKNPHLHNANPEAPSDKTEVKLTKPDNLHISEKPPAKKEPAEKVNITFGTKVKGLITGKARISEDDIKPFIDNLGVGLLESDVNYSAMQKITDEIAKELYGKVIESREIDKEITSIIRKSILSILLKGKSIDLPKAALEAKRNGLLPFKILFVGPNGAGKTTTIAKAAEMLIKSGLTCIISASDTFRAAAVEQSIYHAQKLGIEVIKGRYGADPASIAFDAIAHAKARGIDVVLIDSAGRQETNRSLIEELKKMARVTSPNLKIFVGESIAGNALLDQVSEFNKAISLDGIILTKLDCDAKGGNTLTILSETSIPVLYFGTGEKYSDLMPYDPNFILDSIMPN